MESTWSNRVAGLEAQLATAVSQRPAASTTHNKEELKTREEALATRAMELEEEDLMVSEKRALLLLEEEEHTAREHAVQDKYVVKLVLGGFPLCLCVVYVRCCTTYIYMSYIYVCVYVCIYVCLYSNP